MVSVAAALLATPGGLPVYQQDEQRQQTEGAHGGQDVGHDEQRRRLAAGLLVRTVRGVRWKQAS